MIAEASTTAPAEKSIKPSVVFQISAIEIKIGNTA
jgi:hypothetical protein